MIIPPTIAGRMRAEYPLLQEASLEKLAAQLTPMKFPRKHLLVRADIFNRCAYFIEKGITRSFWLVNGREITTSFSESGGIVFSMDELYYGRLSEEFVETLEDVSAFRIGIPQLLGLFESDLGLANWGRVIHQNEYRRLHRSHKERLTLSAPERYEAFVRQFPDLSRRVNLGYIASYLGITCSTLSRLRGRR